MKKLKFLLSAVCLFHQISAFAVAIENKSFIVTLPILGIGREGVYRGEFNLKNTGSLAVEWNSWGNNTNEDGTTGRQDITRFEQEKDQNASLLTRGQNLGIMISRHTQPRNMSGFHWGLGLGLRKTQGMWQYSNSAAEDNLTKTRFEAFGPLLAGRVGYRYVANWGFVFSSYLGYKFFQNKVKDLSNDNPEMTELAFNDKLALQQRYRQAINIAIEMGWAF